MGVYVVGGGLAVGIGAVGVMVAAWRVSDIRPLAELGCAGRIATAEPGEANLPEPRHRVADRWAVPSPTEPPGTRRYRVSSETGLPRISGNGQRVPRERPYDAVDELQALGGLYTIEGATASKVLDRFDLRDRPSWWAVLVGILALLLFGASYVVDVRVVVVDPDYGDVTSAVRLLWRAILGVTTIGSFLLGIRELVGGDDGPDGPATRVEIGGTGHEINVYPGRSERDDATVSVRPADVEGETEESAGGPEGGERDDEDREE